MTDVIQILAVLVSVTLLLLVLELVRRRKLTEEYSVIWICCAGALLALSVWRRGLDLAAIALGVHYPPALLLLVVTFFVVVVSLYFSLVVSRQRQQIERLLEELALLDADVRDLRESTRAAAAGDVTPSRAGERSGVRQDRRVGHR